jgi:hypothetical protein
VNDTEFDILDELYFVTSFLELRQNLGFADAQLCQSLKELVKCGFIKCLYPDPDSEIEFEESSFAENYRNYFFLATKKGLLQHNSL